MGKYVAATNDRLLRNNHDNVTNVGVDHKGSICRGGSGMIE